MFRRSVVFAAVVLAACGPMRQVDRCRVDGDCLGILVCVDELCVLPMDASVAVRDAGSEPRDAGSGVDAGVSDAGTGDAGTSDAGTSDAGASDAGDDAGVCVPSVELCNGVDDDCDGEIDEGAALSPADGGAFEFDGGFAGPSGMCTVGLGACAMTGTTSCAAGQLTCSGMAGTPGVERCNGRDDDCDGQTDEADVGLCPNMGELCTASGCACPTGQVVCGSTCVTLGGACSAGVGQCQRSGVMSCSGGAPSCSATAGIPSTEVCNGLDDDCDGQTDEVSAGLCPATGQSCNAGTCACPAGQSVCNGACKTLTAEVCDGEDNDCNGQVDEGVTITCLADSDDDGWAGNGAPSSQQCPVNSRQARGMCPVGFVSPAANGGVDCDNANGNAWQVISSRVDADADSYCVGAATNDCVGATPLAGKRSSASCQATDDCNDGLANAYRFVGTRADADADGYCAAGAAVQECIGTTAPMGRRIATSCLPLTDDCNDSVSTVFQYATTAADADNDGYCSTAGVPECIGNAPPAGRRLASSCLSTTDCQDADPAVYRSVSVRPDVDGDGYCTGSTATTACVGSALSPGTRLASTCLRFGVESFSIDCNDSSSTTWANQVVQSDADNDGWCAADAAPMCLGSTAPVGKRFPINCAAGTDCKDTNPNATSTCSIPAGYQTSLATKSCGIGIPGSQIFSVSPTQTCPAGFQYLYGVVGQTSVSMTGNTGGTCTTNSGTSVTMTCGSLIVGSYNCQIIGECVAQ
ncbi:MAG: MopE-related protein [Myxococcaceae bacterium]